MDPRELHIFPNYLLVYMHHFITMGFGLILVVSVYFYNNRQLWNFHKRQIREIYQKGKDWYS
jgi:hypothetical protein